MSYENRYSFNSISLRESAHNCISRASADGQTCDIAQTLNHANLVGSSHLGPLKRLEYAQVCSNENNVGYCIRNKKQITLFSQHALRLAYLEQKP